ncbi:MAG: hypothetical protein M3R04_03090 [bacterium]|nr:hypothetical protein [bacterium]
MTRTRPIALIAAVAGLLCAYIAYAATGLRTEARFTPAKGLVSDAALLGNGHVVLAYPDEGVLADYAPEGKLTRHVIREGGLGVPFKPTMVCAGAKDGLLVFDEEEHHVFRVDPDGNFSKGIDLAVPEGTSTPIAAARIGGLSLTDDGSMWAMLSDRMQFAHFDGRGKLLGSLDLDRLLPYNGTYVRGQVTSDGTVYVLDYSQGAVLYRPPAVGSGAVPALSKGQRPEAAATKPAPFRRVRLSEKDSAFDAAPTVQDFAVLDDGTMLVATTDARRPLLLLSKTGKGRSARPVSLQLGGATRLSIRASRGKFIVWAGDASVVFVLSPQ